MASKRSRQQREREAAQLAHEQWKRGTEAYNDLGVLTTKEIYALDQQSILNVRRYLANIYGHLGQRVAWNEYCRLTYRADRRRRTFAPLPTS